MALALIKEKKLTAFRKNVLNANIRDMTFENVLFPFLFPYGNGTYDGQTTLSKYLEYQMSTLFFPFSLYKPYLLYMHDIHQSIHFFRKISQTCPPAHEIEVLQDVTNILFHHRLKGLYDGTNPNYMTHL